MNEWLKCKEKRIKYMKETEYNGVERKWMENIAQGEEMILNQNKATPLSSFNTFFIFIYLATVTRPHNTIFTYNARDGMIYKSIRVRKKE